MVGGGGRAVVAVVTVGIVGVGRVDGRRVGIGRRGRLGVGSLGLGASPWCWAVVGSPGFGVGACLAARKGVVAP